MYNLIQFKLTSFPCPSVKQENQLQYLFKNYKINRKTKYENSKELFIDIFL